MSTTFKQLCQLCSPNSTLETLKQESLDWQAIWDMALRHRVVPVLANRAKQLKIFIPNDINKLIKEHCHNNLVRGMKQAKEIIRLTKLFKENNIPFVVFKGIALIKTMELELHQRHHGDIDILLADVNDLWVVDELLVSIGYERNSLSKKIDLNTAQKHYFLENRKDLTYTEANQQIKLEIHFKLLNSFCLNSLTPKNIIKNKHSIKLANETIPVMDRTAYQMYLLLHGSISQWFRLKWLLDLSMVSHNGRDYLNPDFFKEA